MNRLRKSVFKRYDVSLSLKLRLRDTCVVSVMTYSAESSLDTDHRNRKDRRM